MDEKKGYYCCICNNMIVRYGLDLEDTVGLDIQGEAKYVCDACSYKIAKQRIGR